MKQLFRYYSSSNIQSSFTKGTSLKRVEVFKVGTYRGKKWTQEDLKGMVKNFNLLKSKGIFPNVPVRVDHSSSLYDVAGYIESVAVKGNRLVADMDITENDVYEKIKRTTYRDRSIEIGTYEDNEGKTYYPVVYGVAWVDIPQVEGLAPVFSYGKDKFEIINLNEPSDMPKPKTKMQQEEEQKEEETSKEEETEETQDESSEEEESSDEKETFESDNEGDDEESEDESDEEESEEEDGDAFSEGEGEEEDGEGAEGDNFGDDSKEGEEEDGEEEGSDEGEGGDEENGGEDEDEVENLIKDIDRSIEEGTDGAFVDDKNFNKKFNKLIKMASDIKTGDIKKVMSSLQNVCKILVEKGQYYNAQRVAYMLESLTSILGGGNYRKQEQKKVDSLPDSSFAVIEPAYSKGETKDLKARHLPFKNAEGKVDFNLLRDSLSKIESIEPITDSISTEDLRASAKNKLTKVAKVALKSAKFAKTTRDESGEMVTLRRDDYNQLVNDSVEMDKLRKENRKAVVANRKSELVILRKEGKLTPAMEMSYGKFVESLSDAQWTDLKAVISQSPKVVKLNQEQVATEQEAPAAERSTSDKDSEQTAEDFIQRTDPVFPEDSPSKKGDDSKEDDSN